MMHCHLNKAYRISAYKGSWYTLISPSTGAVVSKKYRPVPLVPAAIDVEDEITTFSMPSFGGGTTTAADEAATAAARVVVAREEQQRRAEAESARRIREAEMAAIAAETAAQARIDASNAKAPAASSSTNDLFTGMMKLVPQSTAAAAAGQPAAQPAAATQSAMMQMKM